MTNSAIKNCQRLYEESFILPKGNLIIEDMIFASMFYQRNNILDEYWQAKREEEIENEVNSIIEEKI